MGIYIKGMEMPKSCGECFAFDDGGDYPYCIVSGRQYGYKTIPTINVKRMGDCPLTEVPEPHGRLIDETKAMGILDKYRDNIHIGENTLFFTEVVDCTKLVIKELAPTVIERSE